MKLGDFDEAARRARRKQPPHRMVRTADLTMAQRILLKMEAAPVPGLEPEKLSAAERLRRMLATSGANSLTILRADLVELLGQLDRMRDARDENARHLHEVAPTPEEKLKRFEEQAELNRKWLREHNGLLPLSLMDPTELEESTRTAEVKFVWRSNAMRPVNYRLERAQFVVEMLDRRPRIREGWVSEILEPIFAPMTAFPDPAQYSAIVSQIVAAGAMRNCQCADSRHASHPSGCGYVVVIPGEVGVVGGELFLLAWSFVRRWEPPAPPPREEPA